MDYYALDLDRKELERTLGQLPDYKHVRSHGLWGTYDDGREWLKQPSNLRRSKCVLSLGSSIGEHEPVRTGATLADSDTFCRKLLQGRGLGFFKRICQRPTARRHHASWSGLMHRSGQGLVWPDSWHHRTSSFRQLTLVPVTHTMVSKSGILQSGGLLIFCCHWPDREGVTHA